MVGTFSSPYCARADAPKRAMHSHAYDTLGCERAGPAWLVASMLTALRRFGESLSMRGARTVQEAIRSVL